ncbi:TonB-dependent Receptor Plug Domain [Duganella sp. CF517]|uniref:TonB-dependent receptor domain-containing protein n=1 Tax=Duganella sp. CF517 TaxID=1881038 RepID=UPI0008BA42EB|nr:TonB-dependent receptor [Duganella sp. CF517]SEN10302.1 TonB-dependent Receptor Plug Domain [Duganella sp. CF517]
MEQTSKLCLLGGSALTIFATSVCAQAQTTEVQQAASAPAAAQEAPATPEKEAESKVVVVTGSRIRTTNLEPTPTTVITAEKLNATTASSIPDALMKLPAFATSLSSPNSSIASNGAGFGQPGNFLDLRGLGTNRTLILQDGKRVPATAFDGKVDTNLLPQLLLKRVDVVTGGVSSVYGSDAVSGVVNFITDNKFIGVKGVLQGGTSKYRDGNSAKGGLAFGTEVGDRGHFEGSVEFYERAAVTDTASRAFGRAGAVVLGSGTASNPYTTGYNIRQNNLSSGGLVTTGPFAGQRFQSDGSLAPFVSGTPTVTNNLAIGGDGSSAEHQYLLFKHRTAQGFARFDYDLTGNTHFFVQGRTAQNSDFGANQIYTNVSNASAANPTAAGGSYPLWIYNDNAFLTAAQRATLNGAGSFALNRMDNDLMRKLTFNQKLKSSAATAGLNGDVGYGDLQWDAHVTRGSNTNSYTTLNNVNTAKFYAATDAVIDPATGSAVCRVALTAPGAYPGCAPLNLLGAGRGSAAAIDYVLDDTSYRATNTTTDAAVDFNGTVVEGWAGPIKFAAGLEFRHETLGMSPSVGSNVFNPQNLRLGPNGGATSGSYPASNLAYFKEVPSSADGESHVLEKNVEFTVPVLSAVPFAKELTLNSAYRRADYRVQGNDAPSNKFASKTWKLGGDWAIVDGFRVRATKSRDFRAPTLWELYQKQFVSASGVTDILTSTAGTVNSVSGGNPNLKPEVADGYTVGFVFQPKQIKSLSFAFDTFHIKVKDAIGTVFGLDANAQRLCLESGGNSPYCAALVRPISYNNTTPANFPTLVYNTLQNTGVAKSRGFDAEVNYLLGLGQYGDVALRTLWSHQSELSAITIPNLAATNNAGSIDAPANKVNLSATYRKDRVTIDLLQRFISSSNITNVANVVWAQPKVSAYKQTDINFAYDLKMDHGAMTAFLNVSNLFNTAGDLQQHPGYSGSPGLKYPSLPYADIIGRYFTAGVRFKY